MASDLTPDEIRNARFRTRRRGLDSSEVTAFLEKVADEMSAIIEQREGMPVSVGELVERDLESEFEIVGREVTSVLQAAREAAEAMRERASLDATRWRSESMAGAEEVRKEAKSDAEALRGDAWTTGTELLTQTMNEIKRLGQEAERDALTIMGEAEREAHRLTSSARREAEDRVRNAAMDAERATVEATKRRDELIEQAHRNAAGAEERTRALEERRAVLLEELEAVRSTLTRLEGTLEERRDDLNLSAEESTSVKVVQPLSRSDSGTWAPGETVRIITKDKESSATTEPGKAIFEPLGESAPALDPEPEPPPAPAPEPELEPAPAPEPELEPAPAPEPELEPAPVPEPELEPALAPVPELEPALAPGAASDSDDVGALFASLRTGGADAMPETNSPQRVVTKTEPALAPESLEKATTAADTVDWIERRDGRLLPITNRALRGVRKAVTDAQNVALDALRTDNDWLPDSAGLADGMRADLIGLGAESFAAGHDAAEEMVAGKLKRPDTPSSDAADSFGDLLAESVNEALLDAGDGQRERQSATSRVFRAWRSDEAGRRIRDLAIAGYHSAIAGSTGTKHEMRWVPAGTPCTACLEAAEDPRASLPPVHAGCACTIVVA